MEWKQDRLYTSQPYFVMDTEDFRQKILVKDGISHFYTFTIHKGQFLRSVPDGCIDMVFFYNGDGMQGYAIGTELAYREKQVKEDAQVFGVRFMPGNQPELLVPTMRELLGHQVPLETALSCDHKWLEKMAEETTFDRRIALFRRHYLKAEREKEKPFGKIELVQSVLDMAYGTDGKMHVQEMEERTGYSQRYLHRVFLEKMGFSPKTLCKIIQFQRALKYLNYGAPEKMTDAAVMLGYYDQSHFIRDFSRFAGTTPKKYLKMVQGRQYAAHIIDTEYLLTPGGVKVKC